MNPSELVAQKDQTMFRQVCRVRCAIRATPHAIWSLLTDARGFTKSLPDFGPAFETFASDLKRAAERAAARNAEVEAS